jgi:hypothetical protein
VPSTDLNQKDWQEVTMLILKKLPDGTFAKIVVRKSAEERLAKTCFRGTDVKKAGNFSLWNSCEELFSDRLVLGRFLFDIDELWKERDFSTHSTSILHDTYVGWESTDWFENYVPDDVEWFQPNRNSSAFRVKSDRLDLPAPKTCNLTIVFEFKEERDRPVAVVHSIYPGDDIGELKGNVTERESRFFFDWNHPGEA